MKQLLLSLLGIISISAFAANAGPYIGIEVNYSYNTSSPGAPAGLSTVANDLNSTVPGIASTPSTNIGANGSGIGLTLGYNFNRYLALELGYNYLAYSPVTLLSVGYSNNVDAINGNIQYTNMSSNIFDLAVKYSIPLRKNITPFIKFGPAITNQSITGSSEITSSGIFNGSETQTSEVYSSNVFGLLFGTGVSYIIAKDLSLDAHIDYIINFTKGLEINDNDNVDFTGYGNPLLLGVGITYQF